MKPNKEKRKAVIQLKPPTSCQKLKSFLGAIQYFEKFIPKLPEKNQPKETITLEEIRLELGQKRRRRH